MCSSDLGDLDLLVTSIGNGLRAFLNDGKGRFSEITDAAGLRKPAGSHSIAVADIDGDGDLDVYVANYRANTVKDGGIERFNLKRDGDKLTVPPEHIERFRIMPADGALSAVEMGEADFLFINDGGGKFSLASWTDGRFLDEEGKIGRAHV